MNWSLGRAPIATDTVVLAENPHGGSTMNGSYTVAALELPTAAILQTHVLQGTLSVSSSLWWREEQQIASGTLVLREYAYGDWSGGLLISAPAAPPGLFQIERNAELCIHGDVNTPVFVSRASVVNDGFVTLAADAEGGEFEVWMSQGGRAGQHAGRGNLVPGGAEHGGASAKLT